MVRKILPPGAREGQDSFMEALKEADLTPFLFEQFLLEEKDINRRDNHGRTKLIYVSQFQTADYMIDALVQHGADVNAADKDGNTALHHAVESDLFNEGSLLALLRNNANPLAMNKKGLIPLKLAQKRVRKYYEGPIRLLEEATRKAQKEREDAIAHQIIWRVKYHLPALGSHLNERS